MKKITVLLTKCLDTTSSFIHLMCGWQGYTHVSIGLEDHPETYYSFNKRGFCTETIQKHRRRGVTESCVYVLEIPDEAYAEVENTLEHFRKNAAQYHYTVLGMLCVLLHIPFKFKDAYVCSQFVAQVLQKVPRLCDKRASNLYRPNHLADELATTDYLSEMELNPV